MEFTQFAVVGSLAVSVAALLRTARDKAETSGKNDGVLEQRVKSLEEENERSHKYHAEHFQHARDDEGHFKNMDMHWTPRERAALTVMLEKIEKKLDEALERRQGPR